MKKLASLLTLAIIAPQLLSADAGVPLKYQKEKNQKEPDVVPADAKVGPGPYVKGDYLYWIANEEGLEFSVSGLTSTGTTTAVAQGKTREPLFDWNSGFRVGIGYTAPVTFWDASLTWTSFDSEAKRSFSVESITVFNKVYPILDLPGNSYSGAGAGAPSLQSAAAKMKMDYDALDILLGRELNLNPHFAIKPSAGVRCAWIDQHYRITYAAPTLVPADPLNRIKLHSEFFGVGIRGAIDTIWQCHRLVSLFGKAGLTLFHGWFDIRQTYTNAAAGTAYGNLHEDFQRVVSEFDTALGLRIQLGPCGWLKRCELTGAYEFHLYPKQNQFLYFMDDTKQGISMRQRGDLSFQGVSVGATLYF